MGRAVNSLGIPRPKTSRASREDMSIPWREMGLLMCFGRESARVEGDLCAMVFVRGDYKGSGWYWELLLLLLGADWWCTHQRPWWSWWAAFSFFRRRFRQGGFGCTCPREVDAPLSSDAAICTKLWRLGKNCCWMVYGSERDRLMKRMEKESRADCVVWD